MTGARAIQTSVLAAVLMAMTMPVRAGGEAAALTVRLYNTAGIPAIELAAARQTAESILLDAGLSVAIRHCGRAGAPADASIDACDGSLQPSEVVVRVIHGPAFTAAPHSDAYGVAYVVNKTDRGWLATVFADRIARAAARTDVDHGTLLGRVMAHEVGHLLLGSGYHAEAGVMRGDWPDALLDHATNEWRFSVLESARMHRALVSDKFDPS